METKGVPFSRVGLLAIVGYAWLVYLVFAVAARGDAPVEPPPTPCEFERLKAEADLLSADPATEDPCEEYDPSNWDEATRVCTFWCGAVQHVVVIP